MIYQYLVLTQGPIDLSVWQNKPNQDRKKEAGIHLCDTEDEYTMLDFIQIFVSNFIQQALGVILHSIVFILRWMKEW